ncbi:MAG: hypothetical protein V8S74_06090 [Lachnospirales bacterium]
MISDAVQALLESYNCCEEIEAVKKKRNYVDKQLEIFTEEGLKYLENQLANKPSDNSKQEIIRYNKLLTKYNVYKVQRDAYLQMRENIDNYDSIEKDKNRKIKKAKAFERDVIKINNCFENVEIEW